MTKLSNFAVVLALFCFSTSAIAQSWPEYPGEYPDEFGPIVHVLPNGSDTTFPDDLERFWISVGAVSPIAKGGSKPNQAYPYHFQATWLTSAENAPNTWTWPLQKQHSSVFACKDSFVYAGDDDLTGNACAVRPESTTFRPDFPEEDGPIWPPQNHPSSVLACKDPYVYAGDDDLTGNAC